ncbi:hypothetical protein BC829DRAFT_433934 [Chytridium lagenaria]|nr:hypothetical protein BC829DRAFT_433934 [Chytridium lagenaria]
MTVSSHHTRNGLIINTSSLASSSSSSSSFIVNNNINNSIDTPGNGGDAERVPHPSLYTTSTNTRPHHSLLTPPPSPYLKPSSSSSLSLSSSFSHHNIDQLGSAFNLPPPAADSPTDLDTLHSDDDEIWYKDLKLDFVKRMSPEVVFAIFLWIPADALSVCGGVSRHWRKFARDEWVWKEMCRKTWHGKQFHPLELHPLVDWSRHLDSLSKQEILTILKRRGVIIRPGNPASASWPSSAFPSVSLWSWSWATPTTNSTTSTSTSITNDTAWLHRLISATTPLHAPSKIPNSGKWMSSYICSILDSKRTAITRMELSGITWRLGLSETAHFSPTARGRRRFTRTKNGGGFGGTVDLK